MQNRYFILFLLIFSLSGCSVFKSNPQKKFQQSQKIEQKAKEAIIVKENEIEDKGKSFVFGAKYSNEKETNRTPAIEVSGRFLELARLTFGDPSVKDAMVVRKIADELIETYKAETEEAKRGKIRAEEKLQKIVNEVVTLQKEKENLIEIYRKKIEASDKVNEQNAQKAAQWDEENSFINSINPFHDLLKFFKKLLIFGLIGGALIVVFHILEIFFPGLKIVSAIFGFLGKLALKFSPAAKKFAGVVSDNVYKTLKITVKGLQSVFDKLKNYPIEQDIIRNYPEDHVFSKKDVLRLLETHSEKIEQLIKEELDKVNDDNSRAVISIAKSETGIKSMVVPDKHLI